MSPLEIDTRGTELSSLETKVPTRVDVAKSIDSRTKRDSRFELETESIVHPVAFFWPSGAASQGSRYFAPANCAEFFILTSRL